MELSSLFRNAAVMFVFYKAPRAGMPFTGLMHSQNNPLWSVTAVLTQQPLLCSLLLLWYSVSLEFQVRVTWLHTDVLFLNKVGTGGRLRLSGFYIAGTTFKYKSPTSSPSHSLGPVPSQPPLDYLHIRLFLILSLLSDLQFQMCSCPQCNMLSKKYAFDLSGAY